jgi:hypothetical protein
MSLPRMLQDQAHFGRDTFAGGGFKVAHCCFGAAADAIAIFLSTIDLCVAFYETKAPVAHLRRRPFLVTNDRRSKSVRCSPRSLSRQQR